MNIPAPLAAENAVLVVIDFQERLVPVMHDKEKLLRDAVRLIRGARALEVPVILTEQYPKGLGATVPEIREPLADVSPIEKVCFSCGDNEAFTKALEAPGRRQVLVCGIEAHICVYQTAMALARRGYDVQVAGDAVSSREPGNKAAALSRLAAAGIGVTTAEMALFEMLRVAQGDRFKQISSIVK